MKIDGSTAVTLESLGTFLRLTRQRRNLTQGQLAERAGVSRWQVVQMEKGENVSVEFLLKVTAALEVTEVPVAFVTLHHPVPDVAVMLAAAEAIDAAGRALEQVAEVRTALDRAAEALEAVLARPSVPAASKRRIVAAAERLAATPPERSESIGRALREEGETPGRKVRVSRAKDAAAARRRAG